MNESFTVDDFMGVDMACWSQLCPLGPLLPEGEVLLQLASASLQDAVKSWGSHLRPVPRATESEEEKEGAPICNVHEASRGLIFSNSGFTYVKREMLPWAPVARIVLTSTPWAGKVGVLAPRWQQPSRG